MKPLNVILNGFPDALGTDVLRETFRDIPLGFCAHVCPENSVSDLGDEHLWLSPDVIVQEGYEVDWSTLAPIDAELIKSMRDCEAIYLRMASRFERKGRYLSYLERKHMYLHDLQYWNHILESKNIDIYISSNIPHSCYDYVIYCLCKEKGIPMIHCHQPINSIRDILLLIEDYEESSTDLRDRYAELLKQKAVMGMASLAGAPKDMPAASRTVKLAEKYEQYIKEQTRGGEPVPWDIKDQAKRLKPARFRKWLRGVLAKLKNPVHFLWRLCCFIGRRFTPSYWSRKMEERRTALLRRELFAFYDDHAVEPDLSKPYIYCALHFQPELTTSPLADVYVDQELTIKLLSANVPSDVLLYVKDHPFQTERSREKSFYEDLLALPNVRLIPRTFSSFQLAENCIAVATSTGRAAFEGLFRGKPALLFGYCFHQYAPGAFPIRTEEDCKKALRSIIDEGSAPTQGDMRLFLRALQDVSVEGYLFDFFEKITALSHEQNVHAVSSALSKKIKEKIRTEKPLLSVVR